MIKTTMFSLALTVLASGISFGADIKSRPYLYDYGVAQDAGGDMYVLCVQCEDDKLVPAPMPVLSMRFSNTEEPQKSEAPRYDFIEEGGAKGQQVPSVEKPPTASLLGTIQFGFDSDRLKSEERQKLAEISRKNKGMFLQLDGYTCVIGASRYNKELSQRRAKAVSKYLKEHGIQGVSVKGHGEGNPVSEIKSLNRRVEIRSTNKEREDM